MIYRLVPILLIVLSAGHGYPKDEAQGPAPINSPEDDSDAHLEPQESRSRHPSQQTFYPSFSPFQPPPLGHSRPFFFQQEGAYSQRPHSGFQQLSYDAPRLSGYKDTHGYRAAANAESRGLLGSGNFGVLRGGTFYDKQDSDNYDYSPYFRNGHGRPSFYGSGVPNPRAHQHEQFANFRDFADINTPSAYSQYVVVYVNKNATKTEADRKRPKNIIESLALLDLESEQPQKKVSKAKAKLARLPPEKKHFVKKSKTAKEPHEPLLALS